MTPADVGLTLIVAADSKDTIGRDGVLPWHLPDDLQRFRHLTRGHVVVAGRSTHDSIVTRLGRPLPDRITVVVSRSTGHADTEAVHYRHGVDEAIAHARELAATRGQDEVFIIGGAQIYAQALPRVRRVCLTRVHGTFAGDSAMPQGWLEPFGEPVARDERRDGELSYTFETYERGTLYFLGNARNDEQRAEMQRLEAAGVCLFCPPHLERNGQGPVYRTEHWTVVPNRFPYRGTRLHLMLVPDEHVTDMADLSAAAQHDFWLALRWVRDKYRLLHYGLAVRNGLSEYTGGTIRHLHVHLLCGDPDGVPVRVKLSTGGAAFGGAGSGGVDPDQFDAGGP